MVDFQRRQLRFPLFLVCEDGVISAENALWADVDDIPCYVPFVCRTEADIGHSLTLPKEVRSTGLFETVADELALSAVAAYRVVVQQWVMLHQRLDFLQLERGTFFATSGRLISKMVNRFVVKCRENGMIAVDQ